MTKFFDDYRTDYERAMAFFPKPVNNYRYDYLSFLRSRFVSYGVVVSNRWLLMCFDSKDLREEFRKEKEGKKVKGKGGRIV